MAGLVGRIVRGAVAGLVGTLAMDLLWWSRYRRGGGEDGFTDWEFATGTSSFEEASAPAQVGQRVAGLAGVELPDEAAAMTTNVVHWLTGAGYGVLHGLLHGDGSRPVLNGAATGAGAFSNSYAVMGTMGLYEPMWKYDAQTLAKDLSAHLLFGTATGLTYAALSEVVREPATATSSSGGWG